MEKRIKNIKKIAVLTSGGDAPGMNAAIRAVVRTAVADGIQVYGIKGGFEGLVNDNFYTDSSFLLEKVRKHFPFIKKFFSEEMVSESVSQIIGRGGTMLLTSRFEEFKEESVREIAIENLRKRGIQGLVVIGGNGSYRGAWELAKQAPDIKVIGIPATIDNDVEWTDKTIGFATAANTLSKLFDRIRDTARSHKRVFVVAAMGREAGDLALDAGVSCGAEVILIPEFPVDDKTIKIMLEKKLAQGRDYATVVVAEGVAKVEEFAERLQKMGFETRTSDIGHAQRGGSPCVEDRELASRMGFAAVKWLQMGRRSVATSTNGRNIYPINFKKIFTTKDEGKLKRKAQLYREYQEITYGEILVDC